MSTERTPRVIVPDPSAVLTVYPHLQIAAGSGVTLTTTVIDSARGIASMEIAASGGGGSSDHATLTHLAWTSSAHTGTASKIAGFDGGGAASYYTIGTDLQAYSATLAAVVAGTYTGAASITTLGTVTTGTWSGTAIAATKGGTGQTSYAVGDLLYASSTTALSRLAAPASDNYHLGMSGGVPAWVRLALGYAILSAGDGLTSTEPVIRPTSDASIRSTGNPT